MLLFFIYKIYRDTFLEELLDFLLIFWEVRMVKNSIRQAGLHRLKELQQNIELKRRKENEISQLLFNDDLWKKSNVIALTKPMEIEFDTSAILKQGWSQGKQMVMPKVIGDGQMTFYRILSETIFKKSSFGIEEPIDAQPITVEAIDLLVVPGVVFKRQGFRIGFGGGYYDRLLLKFQGASCSLVFKEQIREDWQEESFDIAVEKLFIR